MNKNCANANNIENAEANPSAIAMLISMADAAYTTDIIRASKACDCFCFYFGRPVVY